MYENWYSCCLVPIADMCDYFSEKKLRVMCIPDLVIGGVALLNGLLLNASPTTFCEK